MNHEIFGALDALRRGGTSFVLVTVVEASGSVPGKPGTRMAVMVDRSLGTVGGGRLETEALVHARKLLQARKGDLVRYDLTELAMTCGGRTMLHYDYVGAARRLYVFGGGHVGAALTAMASGAGFEVTVFDDRADLPQGERFPPGVRFVPGSYEEAARQIEPGGYVVVVTHEHRLDEDVVKAMGAEKLERMNYVGVIGSRSKTRAMWESLARVGITPGANFYMPIGLKIGGGTPGDIAASILAELIAVAHGTPDLPHARLGPDA